MSISVSHGRETTSSRSAESTRPSPCSRPPAMAVSIEDAIRASRVPRPFSCPYGSPDQPHWCGRCFTILSILVRPDHSGVSSNTTPSRVKVVEGATFACTLILVHPGWSEGWKMLTVAVDYEGRFAPIRDAQPSGARSRKPQFVHQVCSAVALRNVRCHPNFATVTLLQG